MHITCLDYLAKYATHKIWLKPNGEQAFVYGNHIIKAHLGNFINFRITGKMTENIPQYAGVVILSMNDVPLGFGKTAKSTV